MFETIAKVFAVDVDLGKTIKKTYLDTLFATDDSEAHRFNIILYRDNAKLTIPSDATVKAYFIRYSDDVTIPLNGSVDGNVVSVTLKKSCYNKAGQFALIIKVTTGSETSTVFYGEGAIFTSSTDTILDDEHIIPSIAELLAQIDAMEAATASANTAIGNANTATDNANEAAGNANAAANTANTAAENANEAAGNANTAADTANEAAGKIDSMTVTATTLETGSPATATLETVDGHYQLNLGLPKGNTGNTGATPQISVQVETGAAGSEAHVSVSGTAEEPVIHLTIPKGDTGDIGALSINGKTPDAAGSVTLGIGDIDGLQTAIESAGSVKTVAGKAPDEAGNVAISAADVGARASDWMPTAAQVGAANAEDVSALKGDIAPVTNTMETPATAGKVWTATETGAGWADPQIGDSVEDGAGAHNAVYRGKFLGEAVTEAQYAAIADGTFKDLFIGDYWEIGGIVYRIAAFDYYYRSGDTECTAHHATLVPDSNLYDQVMNDSDTTSGAYVGSKMYKSGLDQAKNIINAAFGTSHILKHRQYLQNATSGNYSSGASWYDSTIQIMCEVNVYGSMIYGNRLNGTNMPNYQTIDKSQYPLFKYRHDLIANHQWFWLRDVVNSQYFASVGGPGLAYSYNASNSRGVRPVFSIIG